MFDERRNEVHNKWLPKSSRSCSRSRYISTTSTMSDSGEDIKYYQTKSSSIPYRIPGRISVHECQHPQDYEWGYNYVDEHKFSTAHNTPRVSNCMISKTPTTSVDSPSGDTIFLPYSNLPNYMANTHSSKARVRSQSAPKQRPELRKRVPLSEIMGTRNSISGVTMQCQWENQKENFRGY